MAFSEAFLKLIANPYAERLYLVTVQPYAIIRASMATQASGNRLVAAAGTFSGLQRLDTGLTLTRPSLANATVSVTQVADDGSWVALSGVTLTDAASATCVLQGIVTRYFSTDGYTTTPSETPPSRWYEARVEVALVFSRSMYSGSAIGGQSIPGYGEIQLHALDGALDSYRSWGWAGRRVRVELGGRGFARADFGVIFDGLTSGISLSDEMLTISVTDWSSLLDQDLYTPLYRGTGSVEGGSDLKGTAKPLCIGKVQNIEPTLIGIVDGRWCYQVHDGPIAAYDSSWHKASDQGQPLTYVSSAPAAGQWTLDATRGLIIVGGGSGSGSAPTLLTADIIGTSEVPVASAARVLEYLARQRLLLDAAVSTSSVAVGTGSRTLTLTDTMPLGMGGRALVQKSDDPTGVWMVGTVTGWSGGTLTLNVTESAGVGTYADWTVTKLGLLESEIASDGTSSTFDLLHTAVPAPIGLYLADATNALSAMDEIANSIGAWYGFDRDGRFDCGILTAPEDQDTVLTLTRAQVLELQLLEPVAPRWRTTIGYARNWRVMSSDELSGDTRRNAVSGGTFDAAGSWTLGTGWAISGGQATATAGTASSLSQSVTLTAGQKWEVAADVTVTAGTVRITLGGVDITGTISASGPILVEVNGAGTQTLAVEKSATFVGAIDNIAITTTRLAFLLSEYRDAADADASTRAIYGPQAIDQRIDTLLTEESDALAQAVKQQALHGAARDIFEVTAKLQPFSADIGKSVFISDDRFGLAAGRKLLVLGMQEDASDNRVTLTVWG